MSNHNDNKTLDKEIFVNITLEELYSGIVKKIEYEVFVECKFCILKHTDCEYCASQGINFTRQGQRTLCINCLGSGVTVTISCPRCQDLGVVLTRKSLDVVITPGIDVSLTIVFPKESNQQPMMIPGDVIVHIKVLPHPFFQVDMESMKNGIGNLLLNIQSTSASATLVPTIDRNNVLKIATDLKSGTSLGNFGLWNRDGISRGQLLIEGNQGSL